MLIREHADHVGFGVCDEVGTETDTVVGQIELFSRLWSIF